MLYYCCGYLKFSSQAPFLTLLLSTTKIQVFALFLFFSSGESNTAELTAENRTGKLEFLHTQVHPTLQVPKKAALAGLTGNKTGGFT